MILGNKCDMQDKRVVSKERGETIAREHGIRFLETSAKANINIDRAFLDLAEAILNKVCACQPRYAWRKSGTNVVLSPSACSKLRASYRWKSRTK